MIWKGAFVQPELGDGLLDAGADPNVQDEAGRTTLHWAAWKGDTKAIAAMVNAGADLNGQDTDGRTPMHLAAERGHTKAIASLTNAGADPNILDSELLKPRDLL